MNHNFEISEYFVNEIKNRPDFRLVLPEPECTNVCFWYLPKSLRNLEDTSDFDTKLHKVLIKIFLEYRFPKIMADFGWQKTINETKSLG